MTKRQSKAANGEPSGNELTSGIRYQDDGTVTFRGKALVELKTYADECGQPMDKFLGLCLWCSLRDTAKLAAGFRDLEVINKTEGKDAGQGVPPPGVDSIQGPIPDPSELEIAYAFDNDLPGPLVLFTDRVGGWYLGDKGQPALQRVTVTQALEWYCLQEPLHTDATGKLGRLVKAAAEQLRVAPGANDPNLGIPRTGLPVKIPRPPLHATAEQMDAWHCSRREAFQSRRKVELTIPVKVGLFTWGILNEASIVHGCTPQEALEMFVGNTDELGNWSESGFPTIDEKEGC
jgi:hypothetical protein